MESTVQLQDFLTSRRAKVKPEQVGLLPGTNRRVPGLRRGEVAQPNLARFTFLDREHSESFHPNWDLAADITVGILRLEAGRDPHDKDLHDLVGELATRSQEFRTRWGAHNVRDHGTGTKHFRHPVVGDLHLVYEAAELVADPGLSLLIYTAEPGSSSADALQLLGSWAATLESADTR
ncbi:hypothetical protein [Cryobacterium arcticum]|uniref:MmyB-like transcription regulator ligand binding domain-containing protein n=1 Tax=Cryobacterium arcticum TaxID=670052 RepID=A0A317ZLJ3_9MICO|nr:hypothetical protein [Cryobacterium arcticum]PXA67286.1 hypothetical protein CTB96_11080 [Cryobacterium arcticum]